MARDNTDTLGRRAREARIRARARELTTTRRYKGALEQIAKTARWYADNAQRNPQEVDHALCVEILDIAERALEA